jgi:hypothetical protein
VESRLVGDVQQPDGQRDTCREEQYEHDQALSETGLAHRPWQRAGDLERRREPVRLRVGKDRTMARRHLAACTPGSDRPRGGGPRSRIQTTPYGCEQTSAHAELDATADQASGAPIYRSRWRSQTGGPSGMAPRLTCTLGEIAGAAADAYQEISRRQSPNRVGSRMPSNSSTTTGSSPTTHASWPGGRIASSPGLHSNWVPSSIRTPSVPDRW